MFRSVNIKSYAAAVLALSLSTSVNAAIIDYGTYTADTDGGLEWLDLTETTNRSFDDISSQLGAGGEFEGWRYASKAEVAGFFDAFGGDSTYYDSGWSTQNNGLFDLIAPLWGDTFCASSTCDSPGDGQSYFITAEIPWSGSHNRAWIYDLISNPRSNTDDYILLSEFRAIDSESSPDTGHALVRDITVVPVPAAAWLFSSGLIGLIGFARRKQV